MVGALSIVRFRNPVRSPFELAVYFAAITMGIATATNINWLFLIISAMVLISFFIKIYSKTYKLVTKSDLFNTSFSEGNLISTLEVTCKDKLSILDNSSLLKSKSNNNEIYSYLLASNDFELLKVKLNQVEEYKELIISYQLNE